MPNAEKLIIIGSGPAGLSAAIYAARGNLNPLVISGRQAGGQLTLTTDVDDFPGFPDGIQGPELMLKMRAQAERFGTRFVEEDVIEVDFAKSPLNPERSSRRIFTIKTETEQRETSSVIIATGASAMWLGLESEQRLIGKGVSACAVCDGFFFKGKNIMVIGGGDTAMREAQHLSKYGKKVTVVHRRDSLRAQDALQKLVKSKENIDFLWNSVVEEVIGQDKVEGAKLKNTQSGKISSLEIDAVFVAIGHKPNTDFLKGQIDLDDNGYIKAHEETKTSVDGIFVAGDVEDKRYKQAVTAAGSGTKAALDVEEYLETQKLPADSE